jgi:hypothetical protein
MGLAASSNQAFLRHLGERSEVSNLDRHLGLRPGRYCQEAPQPRTSLYTLLQILSVTLSEKMLLHQAVTGVEYKPNDDNQCNQLNLFAF